MSGESKESNVVIEKQTKVIDASGACIDEYYLKVTANNIKECEEVFDRKWKIYKK